MRIRAGLPTGVSAVLFGEARARRQLEARLSEQLVASGCQEVLLPIVDYYDPYHSVLDESEKSSLYRFVDRDGELLALRGDPTPMLARLLAPKLGSLTLPLKLFYRGDVVRYQEPRPGRLRESAHLGVELIERGPRPRGPQLDAAVLEMFLDLLSSELERSGSSGRLEVVLGIAGALDDLIERSSDPSALALALSRRDRERVRVEGELALEIIEHGYPRAHDRLGPRVGAEIERLVKTAEALELRYGRRGLRVHVDLAEFVRGYGASGGGLDHMYYDGIVFRAYIDSASEPVGNGGRYDKLFAELGSDVAAAGFSVGLDHLLQAVSG